VANFLLNNDGGYAISQSVSLSVCLSVLVTKKDGVEIQQIVVIAAM